MVPGELGENGMGLPAASIRNEKETFRGEGPVVDACTCVKEEPVQGSQQRPREGIQKGKRAHTQVLQRRRVIESPNSDWRGKKNLKNSNLKPVSDIPLKGAAGCVNRGSTRTRGIETSWREHWFRKEGRGLSPSAFHAPKGKKGSWTIF